MTIKTEGWLVIIGLAAVGSYAVYKKTRPRQLTPEELEFIRPAPFSDQGHDSLAPTDYQDYKGSGAIGLHYTPPEARSRYPMMGLWQPSNYVDPRYEYTPTEGELNTPNQPVTQGALGNATEQTTKGLPEGSADMKLGSANIKNYPDMSKDKVAADARKIAGLVTIWGGQEIQPGEDTPVILDAMGHNWAALFQQTETPIFYRTDLWDASDLQSRHLERGSIPLVTKDSAVNGAQFKSKKYRHKPFAVVNWHGIPGAFHRHVGKGGLIKERQPVWRSEFATRQHVCSYYQQKGTSPFFIGDDNHDNCPMVLAGGKWICAYRIDRIGFKHVPGGATFSVWGNPLGNHVTLNSDHPLLFVSGKIR